MNSLKKTYFFVVTFVTFFLFLSNMAHAQLYTVSGKQVKSSSTASPQLTCTGVKVTKQVKIVSVTGSNAGFWITDGKSIIKQYYSPNDKTSIGFLLNPGTYYVYPRLQSTQTTATVTLGLN